MYNKTVLTFTMTAYATVEKHKELLFAVFLLLYVIAIVLNTLYISVIHLNRELQQPMNVFSCMLSVNEIYGSSALLPSLMVLLLSKTHEVSVKWCMAQVYFLHTYAGAEFCILAIMAYDRFVAICFPLQYHSIMSKSKVGALVALSILYPFILFLCFFSLTIRLSFCGKVVPKLYCVNMELVKNACSVVPFISIIGLVLILFFVFPQFLMIIFSYAQIAKVCRKMSRKSQGNALKTCTPHLVSLVNYTIGALFEIIQTRFNMTHVAAEARVFLSLYFVVMPAISNPVLYGLGTQIVRVHILKLFIKYNMMPAKFAKSVSVA